MDETQTPTPTQEPTQTPEPCVGPDCPECVKRDEETKAADEIGMAILVALMPLLSITLFGNMGLI
ncbi:MAG: hypothetical protein WC608_04250 [Parcubacteria group bacterium]